MAVSVGMSLVINTTFRLKESSVFMRVRKRSNRPEVVARVVAKQTVAGGGFFKNGERQYRPPRPHDGWKLAQSSTQHSTAFSGPALSNAASLGL